ncbi:hypothetical protein SteCoe_7530 [Stentor coeruleus]|uniref:Uncharacterized protein n=1 Tax=Stentor coeruleus TaxID=5963 RepID=A0A1R2CMH1_9CILI|nr:hypothetical protein SteCoe_7530 [Stentor coeruleus]
MNQSQKSKNHLKVSFAKPIIKYLTKSPSHSKSASSDFTHHQNPLNKSSNVSSIPTSEKLRNPDKSKHLTVAYSDWEYFSASKESTKDFSKPLHELRRNIKNPYIYVNTTDLDDDQKALETHLFQAFKNIHSDD